MKTWPKTWLTALAAFLALACAAPALADGTPRLALIINQVDYTTLTPLPDTDGEAATMKTSLTSLGFDVTSVRDATVEGRDGHPSFDQVLTDFRRKVAASPGAIAFIYYTGHGMADPEDEGGENYLLGTDADIKVEADLPASGIKLSQLTTQMSRTGATALIVVLDACRDTPTLGKGVTKGLVAIQPEQNTLIAYSTDLGHVAQTGVYAPVLAKELLKPGEKITDVFSNVQMEVAQQTNQQQQPFVNNRIFTAICLVSCEINVNVQPAQGGMSEAAQMEKTFWTSIQGCDDYKAYLDKYPDGTFASLAKARLAAPACQTAPEQAAATPAAPPAALAQQPAAVSDAYLCDQEAGEEFDNDRPAGNPFVAPGKMVPDRALAACQKALDADPDNRHLMYNLAEAHRWAATADDEVKAQALLYQAAQKGSASAMYAFGIIYSRGEGAAANDALAKQWFEAGANAGSAEAMAWMGVFAAMGRGGPVDPASALAWNQKAAAKGVNYAMCALGTIYYSGVGVTQSYVTALAWYEQAADKDYVPAMTAVAHQYEQGLGVPMNYATAMQWYQKAAAEGDADSMAMLGNMYYQGEGMAADPATARQWYERAGGLGNVASMAMTGAMYQQGLGGPQDLTRAKYWYQLAAAKGDTYSQTQLAGMPN